MARHNLTLDTIRAVKKMYRSGVSRERIASHEGIHIKTVDKIMQGKICGVRSIYECHEQVDEDGILYPPLKPVIRGDRGVGKCWTCGMYGHLPCLACQIKKLPREQRNATSRSADDD